MKKRDIPQKYQKLAKEFEIQFDHDLKQYNTFGIAASAEAFVVVRSTKQLQRITKLYKGPYFILGGGSNLLLTRDIDTLVVHVKLEGIAVKRKFKQAVYVEAGAGVNWHEFVLWTLKKDLGGVENLSLIPGTVGAAPIQNIGAYGVELKDVFRQLTAVDLKTGQVIRFRQKDCQFGYRDSIFKRKYKGKLLICSVTLKLSGSNHKLNTSYGAIRQTLAAMKITSPGIADVSRAVIAIRSSKLPDPAKIGNSGSFFKNPIVANKLLKKIQQQYPNVPHYPQTVRTTKLPAGWLIEQCGWKGKRIGDTGCHKDQALVLVNYGNAKGTDIWQLAQDIIASVDKKFGITLTPEVNVI